MSYYLYNKYDKVSIDELQSMITAGFTIIDYYGLLESNDTTYKYLDISNMPGVVRELTYLNIPTNFETINNTPSTSSELIFGSSSFIKSIQKGSGACKVNIPINEVIPTNCLVFAYYVWWNVDEQRLHTETTIGYELTHNSISIYGQLETDTVGFTIIEFK